MHSLRYFAHSSQFADGRDWQLLADHLRNVANLAMARASLVDGVLAPMAEAAGLLHDLGKYREGFQRHIQGLPASRDERYHKEAGAAKAAEWKMTPVAFAVFGHHGGLPDKADLRAGLAQPSGTAAAAEVWSIATSDCPDLLARLPAKQATLRDAYSADLITRVIFSCLVDADWTDTGDHECKTKGLTADAPSPPLAPSERLPKVLSFIDDRARACPDPHIKNVRRTILDACLAAAERPPGLYSLTVPTGGGKTLAGLAFALKHAAAHGLRRVIYVAPYMSILEQNASVFRDALSVAANTQDVFEHYSLAEPPGDEATDETAREAAARRAETWDAPVVVTTNVQFFESLFSNKPGQCRKLHNIARSVILLDECQTLPPGLVAPTCGMLRQLASELGCTIVFCTATQPAFDHATLRPDERLDASEIIPPGIDLFKDLKRVHVSWPKPTDAPLSWSDVAGQMLDGNPRRQALCVVNTKKAARSVFDELKNRNAAGLFHLSTAMCPAHRREKLAAVRQRLAAGKPCFVVSTQLIEAGVDVDFPFLMRELAPFESIIQAAGRCNREGRIKGDGGRVVVFRSEQGKMPPDRWYNAGRDTLVNHFLARELEPQIDDSAAIRDYYGRLYHSGSLDAEEIQDLRREFQFRQVAKAYRLIDNDSQPLVIATWPPYKAEIQTILAELRDNPRRSLFRALGSFQVNLFPHEATRLAHLFHEEPNGILVWDGAYDDDMGIREEMTDVFIA